jgi:hypothetical protein
MSAPDAVTRAADVARRLREMDGAPTVAALRHEAAALIDELAGLLRTETDEHNAAIVAKLNGCRVTHHLAGDTAEWPGGSADSLAGLLDYLRAPSRSDAEASDR